MHAFRVDDMTCGHCVSLISRSIKAADRSARVSIDLARQLVMVEPGEADAQALQDAIAEAGYTPRPVESAAPAAKPAGAGCGCGCRG